MVIRKSAQSRVISFFMAAGLTNPAAYDETFFESVKPPIGIVVKTKGTFRDAGRPDFPQTFSEKCRSRAGPCPPPAGCA